MQIANSTGYVLRVLIYAASKQGQLVTQQEVADFFYSDLPHGLHEVEAFKGTVTPEESPPRRRKKND